MDPHRSELTLAEAIQYAIGLQRRGRVEEAAAIYRRILESVPNCIEALNFLGVAETQLGRTARGRELIERSLEIDPGYVDAHNNLGNALRKEGRLSESAAAYRRALALRPDSADTLSNLAAALNAAGQHAEAAETARRALALQPDYVEALSVLGRALTKLDDIDGGLDAYRKAVLLSPYDPLSYRRLGYGLFAAGRMDEALDVYQKWLERMPDSAEARHYIAAWTGERVPKRASDEFVRQVFDRFADSFDDVLRGNLGYRAPELLADAIGDVCGPPAGSLDVLDAGCGTGLCAQSLRPYARRLVGVDLSAQMLTRANARGGYDELVCADLVRHLAERDAAYDLIVSADTLVYFGELAEALGAAATSLRPGGTIAFTLERAEEAEAPSGFRLNAHGRYSQTEPYVRAALADAGLETIRLHRAHLRTERGKPVEGLVVVAARRRISAQ